jgi:hypothetical protein
VVVVRSGRGNKDRVMLLPKIRYRGPFYIPLGRLHIEQRQPQPHRQRTVFIGPCGRARRGLGLVHYVRDDENMGDLVNQMPVREQRLYETFGHNRIEASFVGRLFVIYEGKGRGKLPVVLTAVKVEDFGVDIQKGPWAKVSDQKTGESQVITPIPRQLFTYPVLVSIPPRLLLRWDARWHEGKIYRSLSFALLIKTRNKAEFADAGNIYMETPNTFHELYPQSKQEFKNVW